MTTMREDAIAMLASLILKIKNPHPLRVAIDGMTASGKTTLSLELAEALRPSGRDIIRTSIDGFHNPRIQRYRRGRQSAEGYYRDARDLGAVASLLLQPLGPGGGLYYRTASFDLETDKPVTQEPQRASVDAILLVDGTFLQRPELRSMWDFVIFVNTSRAVALERGIARDAPVLGGPSIARTMFEMRYLPAFQIYCEESAPKDHANAIFRNDDPQLPDLQIRRVNS